MFRPRRLGGLLLSIPAEASASLRVFSTNRLERTNTQSWRTAHKRIVRCPRNDTSPRELIASSHRRSPLTRGHPRCGFTTRTGKVARRRPRENKKKSHAAGCVDDSPLASRRILDAPDGCKPPSGLPVHSRVRLLLVSLVGGVGESRLAVVQRAPARGYGWSVSRKSVDRVGARVARRGARV